MPMAATRSSSTQPFTAPARSAGLRTAGSSSIPGRSARWTRSSWTRSSSPRWTVPCGGRSRRGHCRTGARPCRRTVERSRSSGPARATHRSSGCTSSRSTAPASDASRPVRSTGSIPPSGHTTQRRCSSLRISCPTSSIPTTAMCWLSGWTAGRSVASSRRRVTTSTPPRRPTACPSRISTRAETDPA